MFLNNLKRRGGKKATAGLTFHLVLGFSPYCCCSFGGQALGFSKGPWHKLDCNKSRIKNLREICSSVLRCSANDFSFTYIKSFQA